MKRKVLLSVIFLSYIFAYTQTSPQKGFTDKIALTERQYAKKYYKTLLVFNGSNYDLKYHRMRWNVNPDTAIFIKGEVTSYFKITTPTASQLSFDFSSAMSVDSVIYHSSNLTYSLTTNDALIIDLPSPILNNQLDSLTVFYHGVPQGWSFFKSQHDSIPIIWTLSEPFGAKTWWPCKNDLSDKIDSVDIYVTAPQQYSVASNGMLLSEVTQGLSKTAYWKHRYPIAAYLVAIAVTNYSIFSAYAHYNNDSIQILNYVYPEYLVDAQNNIINVVNSMEFFDSLFTPYPFINERYGQTQFGFGGGMEHQTMTFLSDFGHELMAHELAHQWVGDMITCSNWHDIWLNEGFATYWTGLTYEHMFNGFYWKIWKKMLINNITSEPGGSVYCYDTTNVARIFDGRLSYAKGGMLLHMLRWVMGDSAFFAGMRNYLSDISLTYAYACSDDFINRMETASGKILTEFFNDWLYGEGYPIYTIHCNVSNGTNDIQVNINQTQSHSSVGFFEMPVPLKFKNNTKDTIIVFNNTYNWQQYTVNPGFHPDSVLFDPDLWLVSTNDTIIMNTEEYPLFEEFDVFPNPATDYIYLKNFGSNIQKVEIFDIRGIKIYSEEPDNLKKGYIKINIENFSRGIYFFKIIFDNKAVVKKFIKF